ncbi:hypothetical protein ACFW04_014058 [Cataglyphis niger]
MKEEVKEGFRKQGVRVSEEIEKVRNKFRESEKRWKEERDKLKSRIEELEGKMEKTENRDIEEGERSRTISRGVNEGIGNKIKEEERRKNVMIKGVMVKKGRRRVAIKELSDSIRVKAEIVEVRKIGGGGEGGRKMVVVRLKSEEQRMEVWNRKKLLKGRKERILDDWTWKKRRMRWSLERIAREEEKKGRKVWIGYGKIRIDEKWWRWNEEEEVLKDKNGNLKKGEGVRGEKRMEFFWNVAGIRNKRRDFWRKVEEWDMVVMSETWLDKKRWDRSRGYLPKGFRWKVQLAERKNKKGRAMEGMLLGIRKGLGVEEVKAKETESLMEVALEVEGRKWSVIGVYVRGDIERKLEKLNEWTERKEENDRILIGGDFNARRKD